MDAHRKTNALREWGNKIPQARTIPSHPRNADASLPGRVKIWLAISLTLALFLGGCSALQERAPRLGFNRVQDPEPHTLTLWAWPAGDEMTAHLQTVTDAFVQATPGVTVTLTMPDDYAPALERALADEQTPDVVQVDLFRLPALVEADALAPLPADQVDATDLYPLLREGASVDGALYCMPDNVNTLALIYNRDLFDAAGIAYPNADWTWDDLRAAAAAIGDLPTVNFIAFGIALPADVTRWLPFLYQAGGELVDAHGQPLLDSQAATLALAFYTGLITDGPGVEPAYLATGWGGEALGNGRVGMVIEGNWVVPWLDARRPEIDYGVAPLPSGPGGRGTVAFGSCWAVTAESDHPEEALALVRALTATPAMQVRIELSPAIPARPSLARIWTAAYPDARPFLEGLDGARLWQLPPDLQDLPATVNDRLREMIDEGPTTNDQ